MLTTVTSDGRIEIPEEFRKADAVRPGQTCEIERVGEGEYRVRVEKVDSQDWFDWLLACPEKDWIGEPDRNERTTLEAPSLFAE